MTGFTFLDDLFQDLIQRLAHRGRQRLADFRIPYLNSVYDDGSWKDVHYSGQLDRLRDPDGMAGARKDLSTDRAHRSIESMDAARSLPTAHSIDQDRDGRTFHQVDKVNARHLRFDHLDSVTEFLSDPAGSHESDRVVSSHAVTKTDDPNGR